MSFWTLLVVASMPVFQILIISILGAFLATGYVNLLTADARSHINKMVFVVFTPSLVFASLAKTVTFHEIISWWFMVVNIGIIFLIGGILGWIVVKILKPERQLEGLVIATCSAGNFGNLLLIIIPAICNEDGSPFGDHNFCKSIGLSYVSFSMAFGNFYIWSHTYYLIKSSAMKYKAHQEAIVTFSKIPNKDLDANIETNFLKEENQDLQVDIPFTSTISINEDSRNEALSGTWGKLKGVLHQILEELMSPPTIATFLGFIFGATPWLKNLLIGDDAPLRVIQDSIKLLGDGTIPCITLILGGNLTQGLRTSKIKPLVVIGIICVRYIVLPVIGMGVVKGADRLGFLPADPLYHFVLMVQFTLPPAMSIGTMTQLFGVGQEATSVIFLWTYLAAAIALTVWSTIYMWILS